MFCKRCESFSPCSVSAADSSLCPGDPPTALSSGGVHHPDCSLREGLVQSLTQITAVAIRRDPGLSCSLSCLHALSVAV
ncbi:hypothetical protein CesoFtcFv8_025247 [Champsocephalus esox]|uniref:Uncharacterized protein n=2 Tax=Champsocephalus TaxID=52236 RepID=A0AAN8C8J0_CHAGU|nr:hypothetical protein CesoFtcFv8_025247 [Champsocephalus esox]KAK5897765.1 hypothetical protein CgunFtcFv8_015240 [Champsocephalus gunnari]